MDFDWAGWLKLIIGAGIGSALVQSLLPIWREHHERKKQAAYMAMRLAVALENFAWACANFIQNNRNAQTLPDDEYPAWDVTLPELTVYPDEGEGWRAIDRKLAGRCLDLRNRILESQSVINGTIEFFMDDLDITLDEYAAGRGLDAWNLAMALRKQHGLESIEPEWDYVDDLQRALSDAQAERESRQARRREPPVTSAAP